MFLNYLLRNRIDNKLYILGFVVAVLGYSCWQPIEDVLQFGEQNQGKVFFISMAFSFCCYTSAYMFSRWDSWRWFPMVVVFICIGRLIKEFLFLGFPDDDPTKYDWLDYAGGLTTPFVVFNYYIKYRHKKFKQKNSFIKK